MRGTEGGQLVFSYVLGLLLVQIEKSAANMRRLGMGLGIMYSSEKSLSLVRTVVGFASDGKLTVV